MRVTEALEVIARLYVPGTVHHFSKKDPDPWQKAHDDLERIAGIVDDDTIAPVVDRFVQRCAELIEEFKREGAASKSVAPIDAHILGERDRVDAYLSRKNKHCAKCRSKENLKIVPFRVGSLEVQVLCGPCSSRKDAA